MEACRNIFMGPNRFDVPIDKPHKYSTRKSRPELDSDFHKFTNG